MMKLDVWLYGPLAHYAPGESHGSHAHLLLEVPEGTRMADLLGRLGMPWEERGLTFVNAQLTGMPDVPADLELELKDGDRVGIFHRQSMWPFQYRFGASVSSNLTETMRNSEDGLLRHSSASIRTHCAEGEGGGAVHTKGDTDPLEPQG